MAVIGIAVDLGVAFVLVLLAAARFERWIRSREPLRRYSNGEESEAEKDVQSGR